VAWPAVAVALAGSNTVTMAAAVTAAITNTVTTSITIAVASPVAATVTTTGSSTAAAPTATTSAPTTVREGRSCRQGGHHQREHEHTESCHVAPPPCGDLAFPRAECPPADGKPSTRALSVSIGGASEPSWPKGA
jgi:hypothetical protein